MSVHQFSSRYFHQVFPGTQERAKVPAWFPGFAVDHEILPAPMTLAAPEQTADPPFTNMLPHQTPLCLLYPSFLSPLRRGAREVISARLSQ